jgi:hypothetical protein
MQSRSPRGQVQRRYVAARGSARFGSAPRKWHGGISTDDFVRYSYFSLAIIWARNVKLASSRGFSTDNTHIWDAVCRIATAKI